MKLNIILFFLLSIISQLNNAQTVGLIESSIGVTDGYVLFSPMTSTNTYLIDKCGEKVHEWTSSSNRPALSSFLTEDGSLLRTGKLNNVRFNEGGSGGIIERFDWDGNLIWNYTISDTVSCLHHDIKMMPNGNILCIVWDSRTSQEAFMNGKNTSYAQQYLWSERIVELKPIGTDSAEIVWEWKLFDHLIQDFDNTKLNYGVVADHPELVDINYFPGAQDTPDWIHLNSLDYNEELDQILLSSHRMCEVWIIDHSTTTAEASSHNGGNIGKGGDLLYRWGNPQAYQSGTTANKIFYGQHHASWIPSGNSQKNKILVFNNGLGRIGDYSSIDIFIPPLTSTNNYTMSNNTVFLPNGLDWSYSANIPSSFYSSNISGVYPLDNGSYLITEGASGRFFEINEFQQKKWEYVNPVYNGGIGSQGDAVSGNPVFRCNQYPPDYDGFIGKILSAQGPIELNPTQPSICESLDIAENELLSITIYPNPFSNEIKFDLKMGQEMEFKLYNSFGQVINFQSIQGDTKINSEGILPGIYFYELSIGTKIFQNGKLVKQ